MGMFFRSGGWGMYPTALFGFFLVAATVLYLLKPERRVLPLMVATGIAAFASGLLGFASGLVNTFTYLASVAPEDQLVVAAAGAAESLNNVVLALILIVLSALLASVGALRASLRDDPVVLSE